MSRRIVKSWSNGRLLHEARAFLTGVPEAVAILPSRSPGQGMAQIADRLCGVHQLTLIQLAAELSRPIMATRGLVPLSSLGLEAVAARSVHTATHARELNYFLPVADSPGFAKALSRTLRELRLARITPEQVAAAGEPGADLSRLLARFEEELESRRLADLALMIDLAIEGINGHRLSGLPLLLLDPPMESLFHRELLRGLAQRAPSLLAAITAGEREWEEDLSVRAEVLDPDRADSPMERLRQHLFTGSSAGIPEDARGFEILSAPGEGLEAVEIARRVLRLAREGVPFDEIAILLRNPDRQQVLIEEALRRARIPAYMSRGSARPDPSGRALLALLACAAEKCSASRFAEYLSLGQVPRAEEAAAPPQWVAPADEALTDPDVEPAEEKPDDDVTAGTLRAPSGWEKLLVDAAVIGGRDRWERRLRGLEQELDLRVRSVERTDDPRLPQIRRQLEQLKHLEKFALPLIETLDLLPRATLWGEWIAQLSHLARVALRKPEPVLAVLAEFEPMSDTGPATLEEVFRVLSERLRFLRREPPRRRWGHVFVGSIEESRGREFHTVFLPGLAEGMFPQRALEDPLLLDFARKTLSNALPLRLDRVTDERLRLRLAVAAAREQLIASYSRMDVSEARPRVPSFYALELPRAVEGKLPGLKEFEKRSREACPSRLNWPAPREIAEAIDDAEYDLVKLDQAAKTGGGARYLVEANPHLARSLRGRWERWHSKWTQADGLIAAGNDAQAALGEHRMAARPWSPSALEQFSTCPYKFALNGILRLKPREEAVALEQLDPLTRGALFHEVQFALLGELKEADLLPVNRDRLAQAIARCDRVLDRVAAEYREKLAPAIPRVWHTEMEDLRTDLRGWLQQAAQNDNDWQPVHFEFAFGLEPRKGRDASSTATEAVLTEGVRLRGSIDMVERNLFTRTLRVTDHKTGKAPEQVPAYVGGGRFLQPILYALAAEKLLGEKVEAGRLFYATQRGGYQHMLIPAGEASRRFLARLLQNIDGAIASGFLPPAPQKDACSICDYRLVCGPYEEQRFTRNKNRKDERLEPLFEIRSML
jgi:ATP-dependent helicase/nuclease subunit B